MSVPSERGKGKSTIRVHFLIEGSGCFLRARSRKHRGLVVGKRAGELGRRSLLVGRSPLGRWAWAGRLRCYTIHKRGGEQFCFLRVWVVREMSGLSEMIYVVGASTCHDCGETCFALAVRIILFYLSSVQLSRCFWESALPSWIPGGSDGSGG